MHAMSEDNGRKKDYEGFTNYAMYNELLNIEYTEIERNWMARTMYGTDGGKIHKLGVELDSPNIYEDARDDK
jgi:hypothetical protein